MGNLTEVQKNFGQRAKNYRVSSTHNNPADLRRMIRLLDPQPHDTALDAATGGGHTAVALAKHAEKVIAVDITREMLTEAAAAAGQAGAANIVFQAEDVHALSFHDNTFDLVASRFAPHHFSHIQKALQEMCRVLKPGGKLYILDCSVWDGDETEEAMNHIEKIRDSSHICSYSPRRWRRLLAGLPLSLTHEKLLQTAYELPIWFERMGAGPQVQKEIFQILNELSDESKARYPFGPDFITTYRFEAAAVKI